MESERKTFNVAEEGKIEYKGDVMVRLLMFAFRSEIKLLLVDRRVINQCTENGGELSGSKHVICLWAEMKLDIHTGMVMNMELGRDFDNGAVQDDELQSATATAVGNK